MALVGTAGLALLFVPRPAPACDMGVCPTCETWELELIEVEVLDDAGDTDATLPEWPEAGWLFYDRGQLGGDGRNVIFMLEAAP